MRCVIHWSYTFPANFSDRVADIINSELDFRLHHSVSLHDARSFDSGFTDSITHVVHSALNIPSFLDAFNDTPFILFIHGQHDTSQLKKVRKIIRECPNIQDIFVTTPDLLHIFENAKLFPFAPLDTLHVDAPVFHSANKTGHKAFSNWKGRAVDIALKSRSYLEFRIRISCYGPIRRTLFKLGKMYSLQLLSKSINNRLFITSRSAYLNSLASSSVIVDTDEFDFPYGGNISMTGLDALALGIPIYSGISDDNLLILEEFYEDFPKHLVIKLRTNSLWSQLRTAHPDNQSQNFPNFNRSIVLKKWQITCPIFFKV